MADSTIPIDVTATPDTWIDTEQLTVGVNTVQRERMQIAGAAATEIAKVVNAAPGASDFGLVARLGSSDGTDIGNVDVASVVPGTGATNLGKAIDSAGGATDTGVAPLAIRDDALTTLTPIDGDYVGLRTNSVGALWVAGNGTFTVSGTVTADAGTGPWPVTDNAGSLTVDNAGTFAVQVDGAALTALQLIDDVVKTDDAAFTAATDKVAMFGAVFDDVTPDSVDEGDAGALRMSANRNLFVNLRDAAGNERGANVDASNNLQVIAASNSGVDIGDVTLNNGFASVTGSGVESTALRVTIASDSTGVLSVDDNGGAITVDQATASSLNAQVVGEVAHDAADSGNPVKIGAVARTANPTAVAGGDRVNIFADELGRIVTKPHTNRDRITRQTTTISASTAETTVVTAGGAGVMLDLIGVYVANTSATAARVDFRDATAGSVIFSIYAPAGQTTGFMPPVAIPQAAANNNWTAQSSASVTDLRVFAICVQDV